MTLRAGLDPCRVLDELLRPPVHMERDEEESRRFLFDELQKGRLRQGWGFPGLDLRRADFRDRFVIALRRYWGGILESDIDRLRSIQTSDASEVFGHIREFYARAEGRHRILRRMQEMNRGDVVFVPNFPAATDSFAVARIAGTGYSFEDRGGSGAKRFSEADFGHRRDVTDVRVFEHSPNTLPTSAFGPPFRKAIDPVPPGSELFEHFLANHYRSAPGASSTGP